MPIASNPRNDRRLFFDQGVDLGRNSFRTSKIRPLHERAPCLVGLVVQHAVLDGFAIQFQAPVPDAVALEDEAVHVPRRLGEFQRSVAGVVLMNNVRVVQLAFS